MKDIKPIIQPTTKLDGRSSQAQALKRFRDDLLKELGERRATGQIKALLAILTREKYLCDALDEWLITRDQAPVDEESKALWPMVLQAQAIRNSYAQHLAQWDRLLNRELPTQNEAKRRIKRRLPAPALKSLSPRSDPAFESKFVGTPGSHREAGLESRDASVSDFNNFGENSSSEWTYPGQQTVENDPSVQLTDRTVSDRKPAARVWKCRNCGESAVSPNGERPKAKCPACRRIHWFSVGHKTAKDEWILPVLEEIDDVR